MSLFCPPLYLCVCLCLFGLVHIPTEQVLKHPIRLSARMHEGDGVLLDIFCGILFSEVLLKFVGISQFGLKSL